MSWRFWKKEVNEEKNIQEETRELEQLKEELTTIQSQIKSVSDQVTKLTRIQFKSSKNVEEKLDRFNINFSEIYKQNDMIQSYEKKQSLVLEQMIRLLDEMDHVVSGINESDQVWYPLLKEWSLAVEKTLETMGVYTLNVIGETFNPEVAESMEAVAKATLHIPPAVPYEVIEVLKRGYIDENGKILRKAKVITVKEEL